MPYDITWEPHGVYKKFWGFVTASEFIQSVGAFHNDPRFDDFLYTINDFLAVEGFDVSLQTIEYVAALNLGAQAFHPHGWVAAVTTDERITALARHFSSPDLDSYPTEVFASVAAAREWIGGNIAVPPVTCWTVTSSRPLSVLFLGDAEIR